MITLETLFKFYEAFGDVDYIGEPVTQREHMQQAAWLARHAGADESFDLIGVLP